MFHVTDLGIVPLEAPPDLDVEPLDRFQRLRHLKSQKQIQNTLLATSREIYYTTIQKIKVFFQLVLIVRTCAVVLSHSFCLSSTILLLSCSISCWRDSMLGSVEAVEPDPEPPPPPLPCCWLLPAALESEPGVGAVAGTVYYSGYSEHGLTATHSSETALLRK